MNPAWERARWGLGFRLCNKPCFPLRFPPASRLCSSRGPNGEPEVFSGTLTPPWTLKATFFPFMAVMRKLHADCQPPSSWSVFLRGALRFGKRLKGKTAHWKIVFASLLSSQVPVAWETPTPPTTF